MMKDNDDTNPFQFDISSCEDVGFNDGFNEQRAMQVDRGDTISSSVISLDDPLPPLTRSNSSSTSTSSVSSYVPRALKRSASESVSTTGKQVPTSSTDGETREKPKRPLSAYNIFFQRERQRMLQTMPTRPAGKPRRSHGKIGFAEMARSIAAKWKSIDPETRAQYDQSAAADKQRYIKEMEEWRKLEQEQQQQRRPKAPKSLSTGSLPPLHNPCLMQSTSSLIPQTKSSAVTAFGPYDKTLEKPNAIPALMTSSNNAFSLPGNSLREALKHGMSGFERNRLTSTSTNFGFPGNASNNILCGQQPMACTQDPFHFGATVPSSSISDLAAKLDDDCLDLLVKTFR